MTGIRKARKGTSAGKTGKLALNKETVKDLSASRDEAATVKGGMNGSYVHQTQVYACN